MALKVLSSLASWGLCSIVVLVLAFEPAHGGFSFGLLSMPSMPSLGGLAKVFVSPQPQLQLQPQPTPATPDRVGICAASINPYGYKCLELYVTTEDGYILNVQRITRGGDFGQRKQPVLIQHGLFSDGVVWFLNSPDKNLPMILADNGFDVWVANTRGTRFSRKHTSIDPSSPSFWNWSWDELASYDLPAVVNYICRETGQKVDYVGHSQGTLVVLTSFSERRLVNQLRSAVLLSPIAYLSHTTSELAVQAAKSFNGELSTVFGPAEFNPGTAQSANFLSGLCVYPGSNCGDLLTSVTGKNCCLNSSSVATFLKETQSTSTKNMAHLSQNVRTGILAKYKYRGSNPQVYELLNIPREIPLFISYGGQDALSNTIDVGLLLDKLKIHNADRLTVQFVRDYAHVDFLMAVNVREVVYNPVLSFLQRQY